MIELRWFTKLAKLPVEGRVVVSHKLQYKQVNSGDIAQDILAEWKDVPEITEVEDE